MSLLSVARSVEPRYLTVPRAASTAADEVVEYAALAGMETDEAERLTLETSLGERADGRWAASQVGLIAPRQNLKTHVLMEVALTAIGLWGEQLVIWTAHRLSTAMEAWRIMRQLVTSSPALAAQRPQARHRQSGGAEIEFANGARVVFMARSAGATGRGFSAERLFLDEAFDLTDDDLAALLPALSARPNHQVWYASSAPKPYSEVLRRVCSAGRRGAAGVAYLEWCADEEAASDDREAWAAANPAYPERITEETILGELATMSDEDFRRERLGIWREDLSAGWQVIAEGEWSRVERPRARMADPVAFGVWVSPDRKWAAIGAAGQRADAGSRLVELTRDPDDAAGYDYRPGTGWLLPRMGELQRHRPLAVVTNDRGLADQAAGQGLTLHLAGPADQAAASGMFYDGVVGATGQVRHLGQHDLTVAVAGAVKRKVGQGWVWDQAGVDICPVGSVSLALWGLLTPRVHVARPVMPMAAYA